MSRNSISLLLITNYPSASVWVYSCLFSYLSKYVTTYIYNLFLSLFFILFNLLSFGDCSRTFISEHIIILRGWWFLAFLRLITKILVSRKIVIFVALLYFLNKATGDQSSYFRVILPPLILLFACLFSNI